MTQASKGASDVSEAKDKKVVSAVRGFVRTKKEEGKDCHTADNS